MRIYVFSHIIDTSVKFQYLGLGAGYMEKWNPQVLNDHLADFSYIGK